MLSKRHNTAPTLESALQSDTRDKLIISDFDETLCHHYEFDAATNNHHAIIDPELADAAAKLPLIIATATRAIHPKITQIRESKLVPQNGLLIAENGGVIVEKSGRIWWSVEEDEAAVGELRHHITRKLPRLFTMPQDMQLVAKQGLTSLIMRAQTERGEHDPSVQTDLQSAVQTIAGDEWTVVDGGRSLTVQRPGVSKINALPHTGLELGNYSLIGLGDGENDIDLLDRSDIAIAVGERVADHADFVIDPNVPSVTAALRLIGRAATSFPGWSRWSPEEEEKRMRDRVWY